MKNLYSLTLLVFFSTIVSAQKLTPVIKPGTVINMVVTDHGLVIPVSVTIKNTGDTLNLAWEETKTAANKKDFYADRITRLFTQPHQEGVASARFQNDETFISVSRTLYKRFLNSGKKTLLYQNNFYSNAMDNNTTDFTLEGRFVDATYLETKDGKYQLWLLNYAPFPLILQTKNPLLNLSYKVVSIK